MSRPADRLTGAALALLLQAGFIAAFLHMLPAFTPPKQLAHELTFFLPPLPRVTPPKPAEQSSTAPRPVIVPRLAPPTITSAPLPEAPSAQTLQNFGQALSGCAPENYANLTPQQKAQCPRPGEGVAIQQAPNLMGAPSHVKDEAHWREEWAREQSPVLLPCLGGVDIACLLGMLASGHVGDFGDPHKWPHYEVAQLPPEDFYKIEQAYDAWNKAHTDKQASTETAPAP